MAEIVLTTLNAKYAHASFGLRYLLANLSDLAQRATLLEFDISHRTVDVLERILSESPRIVGVGVYIWNVDQATRLVADLKRVRPDITVVLGGPEVSYETDNLEIVRLADFTVTGEADLTFRSLCEQILAGKPPESRLIPAELPRFDQLRLPYGLYDNRDIAERVIYVEASRGCPYECEFCLSSLDIPVRQAPLDAFLESMQSLLDRGVNQFKFVDRTFNLNLKVSRAILEFFAARYRPDLFLHFEMIPDRLPDSLREIIRGFPAGSLQFEVGIQTFNPLTAALISRRQDYAQLDANLTFLRQQTGVHIHADLIVGLPGEDVASFGAGFDKLVSLGPQEIQVGMLKKLRGTPISRHDADWTMVYSRNAPYEILATRLIDFAAMQRLRRFARYWDLVANSGNFVESTPLIWSGGSAFAGFLEFSDWLFEESGQTHAIALKRLAELVFRFLVESGRCRADVAAQAIWHDYRRAGRSDLPPFLREHLPNETPVRSVSIPARTRQARHAAN